MIEWFRDEINNAIARGDYSDTASMQTIVLFALGVMREGPTEQDADEVQRRIDVCFLALAIRARREGRQLAAETYEAFGEDQREAWNWQSIPLANATEKPWGGVRRFHVSWSLMDDTHKSRCVPVVSQCQLSWSHDWFDESLRPFRLQNSVSSCRKKSPSSSMRCMPTGRAMVPQPQPPHVVQHGATVIYRCVQFFHNDANSKPSSMSLFIFVRFSIYFCILDELVLCWEIGCSGAKFVFFIISGQTSFENIFGKGQSVLLHPYVLYVPYVDEIIVFFDLLLQPTPCHGSNSVTFHRQSGSDSNIVHDMEEIKGFSFNHCCTLGVFVD